MSSFNEIKELRQAGRLEEALQKSNELLESQPDNIWNKRVAAWVYYDYLKKYAEPDSYESFKEYLFKVKELRLPEDEKMIFDNCGTQVSKMVFAFQREQNINYSQINELFDFIKEFHFTKPSENYSFIYRAFHKGYQGWSRYLEFADWWNFDNFRPEDYNKETFKDKKIMSIVEQAYNAYAKKLLEGEPQHIHGPQRVIDKEKVKLFLPKLDDIISKHPDYQYPPYFKAKLLLSLGSDENVMAVFLPFAKQKKNDFWVWDLMAEIFKGQMEVQLACYCKALSLKTPEDFLGKIRQKMASILISKGMYNEAKTEIQKIIDNKLKNEFSLPEEIKNWTMQGWYLAASSGKDNFVLYKKHIQAAEELLFQDVKEELVAVEFVNEDKQVIHFVKDENMHGFFKYADLLTNPRVGDILKVRFRGSSKDNFFKAITAKIAEPGLKCDAIKSIDGKVVIQPGSSFGFVGDVFLEPGLIHKFNVKDGQEISGRAIMSYNKKKNKWGWKVVDVHV